MDAAKTQKTKVELTYANGTWSVTTPAHLYVKCTTSPSIDEPELTDDDIANLTGAVEVECTATTDHADKAYGILSTYTKGEVNDKKCTLELTATQPYITQYDKDVDKAGHELDATKTQKTTVELTYANGTWSVTIPAHLYVKCTTGGGELPPSDLPTIDKDNITGLLIKVDCTTNTAHSDKDYESLLDGSYTFSAPVANQNSYTATVTVKADKYVEDYNSTIAGHTLTGTDSYTINLAYDKENQKWEVTSVMPIIFTVTCTTGGGGYNPTPTYSLTISKQVVGLDSVPAGYEVTVNITNKTTGLVVKTVKLGANGTQTVSLPYGVYMLTEVSTAVDGYKQVGQTFSKNDFTLSGSESITVTNTYEKDAEEPIVDPTDPTKPEDPAVDPDDGNAGDDNQADTHKVPKTGDNLPMDIALYAFLAAGAAVVMRKAAKKESK